MTNYGTHLYVRQVMQERLQEAERERLVQLAQSQRPPRERTWHSRLHLGVVRRLVRLPGAS